MHWWVGDVILCLGNQKGPTARWSRVERAAPRIRMTGVCCARDPCSPQSYYVPVNRAWAWESCSSLLGREESCVNDIKLSCLSYPGSGLRHRSWMTTGTGVRKPPFLPLSVQHPPKMLPLQWQPYCICIYRGDERQHGNETGPERDPVTASPQMKPVRNLTSSRREVGFVPQINHFTKWKSGNRNTISYDAVFTILPESALPEGISCGNEGSNF